MNELAITVICLSPAIGLIIAIVLEKVLLG